MIDKGLGFLSLYRKQRLLLGFLHYGASVEGPGDVLHHINTKEFGALDDLHSGFIDMVR